MPDYLQIFCGHINRLIEERGMTRQELAATSGISGAMLTDISRGTANPTLKSMETLAEGLGVPLPLLLKPLESDEWQNILFVMAHQPAVEQAKPHVPQGYELLEQVILPKGKIEIIMEWLQLPRRGRPRKE